MKRYFSTAAAVLALCIAFTLSGVPGSQIAYAADGDLDPDFGVGGLVASDLSGIGSDEVGSDVAVQPDGKIVVVGVIHGAANNDFIVARYNSNGDLDTTFGIGGTARINFNDSDSPSAVALQSDGKIVVVGATRPPSGTRNYAVARLQANGELDTGFDGDGKVTSHISGDDFAKDVAIQADGKIVVAGYSGLTDFSLARYNTDGSLDTGFNGTGKVMTDIAGSDDQGTAVQIRVDGRIVVAGYASVSTHIDFALALYNSDGSLSTNFSQDGKTTAAFGTNSARIFGMDVQPDGKIVSAGSIVPLEAYGLTRHTISGQLDTTFDADGMVTIDLGSVGVDGGDVAIQPDGKIVVAAFEYSLSACLIGDFVLLRYLPNGAPDPSFGVGGLVRTDFNAFVGCDYDAALGLDIQADGKIVAAGFTSGEFNQNYNFALARYRSGDTVTPTPTSTLLATSTSTSTSISTTPSQTPTDPTSTPTPPISQTPVGPTVTPIACTLTFTDVPLDHTFYANIRCLACRGIINGYDDNTFRPGNLVTRGQLSKIVSNAAGFQEPVATQSFEDVPVGSTFHEFVGRLAARGFINGYACGGSGELCVGPANLPYFRPNANVTRGQMSKIVSESADYNDVPTGQQFEDVPEGSTFYDYTFRLYIRNIMQGYPCGGAGEPCGDPALPYFRPGNNATRGQASKIVANTFFPGCLTP